MALDKLTKLTSNSGISTVIDYTMSDLVVDSINIAGGGTTLGKDFETRNLKVTGLSTFVGNVQMDGNLTVNGTTTTLDTNLIGVDRVEVVANDNNYAGIAVTQSGTGDIISAYDGSTQVFVVSDGNRVGIADSIYHLGDDNTAFGFPSADTFKIDTAGAERLRITSTGKVGMGLQSTSPGGTCNPDDNTLLIRAASTFQTTKGHIMLSGDGATNGEGPQIVFSESGSGGNFAGAYVGHVRTGSNSIGDLVFGTRATGGDANTVPTERLRIKSDGGILQTKTGGNANFTISRNESVGSTNQAIGVIDFASNTAHTVQSRIMGKTLGTSNVGGDLVVETRANGGSLDERVRFTGAGKVGIGVTNPDTLLEISSTQSGTGDLLKITSTTNSQSSRPGISFWNNNPNTAQAQISAKGGASYNASKLHFAVANTSRTLVDRACIDENGTFIIGPGEVRRNTKGSNQHQALLVEGTGNNSTRMSMIRSSNDDVGPEIQLIKTRGTSVGSVTKPNGQDYIGSLTFLAGDDSDLYSRSAEIGVQAQGTPANDTCPGDIIFSVTNFGANAPTERLRIGAAGITTSNASMYFPDGKQLVLGNSSDLQIWHDGNHTRLSDRGGTGNLQIETNSAILMQVNDSTNAMAKFFPSGNYQNEFYNDNAWDHPKLRTTDRGIDIFHQGDYGLQFSDDIGEIGDVAGFQAINKAASSNTDFGIRATSIRLATGSTERMRVQSDGRVKIGAVGTAALGALHIEASNSGTDTALFIGSNSDNRFLAVHENSGNSQFSHLELKYNDNGKRAMLQMHNPYSSGTGFGSQILFKGHGGGAQAYIETSNTTSGSAASRLDIFTNGNKGISIDAAGQVMCCSDISFAGLPVTSGNSSMFVRGDSGAWALKLLCRHDQNDYAYLGFASQNNSENLAEIYTHRTGTSQGSMYFGVRNGGGALERLRLSSGGEVRIADELTITRDNNNTSGFSKGGKVLDLPAYKEYHYTWSGQSSYTIDLTCGSYFHSEFIYTQHQTNGGNQMHHYVRGKWANNHTTHTGFIYEFSGNGASLNVAFTVSDQSGGGAVDMKGGLTSAGSPGASYRASYGGGHEGGSGTANGRFRIAETMGSGSVSTRGLIIKVYYGSFSISKS